MNVKYKLFIKKCKIKYNYYKMDRSIYITLKVIEIYKLNIKL